MTEPGRLRHVYPEVNAGGFSRTDGTIEFYTRLNALLEPGMHVLDYGAGRGAQLSEDPVAYRAALATIQGKVARVVAVDVDPAVLDNAHVDEAHVVGVHEPLPFPDGSFDLVFADWVVEHVADPAFFESEIARLLRPGGWFCARTPNRRGLAGLGARLVPNRLHTRLLAVMQPWRREVDVFPVEYRMNTLRQVRDIFDPARWRNASYLTNAEPPYVTRWPLLMRTVQLYWRLVPTRLYTNLHLFVQRV